MAADTTHIIYPGQRASTSSSGSGLVQGGGGYWKGKLVAFSLDNQAVVEIINKSHSKESHLMHLIRLLTFYACHYGFEFRAEHIPGKENNLASTLSQKNVSFF